MLGDSGVSFVIGIGFPLLRGVSRAPFLLRVEIRLPPLCFLVRLDRCRLPETWRATVWNEGYAVRRGGLLFHHGRTFSKRADAFRMSFNPSVLLISAPMMRVWCTIPARARRGDRKQRRTFRPEDAAGDQAKIHARAGVEQTKQTDVEQHDDVVDGHPGQRAPQAIPSTRMEPVIAPAMIMGKPVQTIPLETRFRRAPSAPACVRTRRPECGRLGASVS